MCITNSIMCISYNTSYEFMFYYNLTELYSTEWSSSKTKKDKDPFCCKKIVIFYIRNKFSIVCFKY